MARQIAYGMMLALLATAAQAQQPYIPPEFYDARRPDFGQSLPLCLLPDSVTAAIDDEMARLIADRLLLQPATVPMQVNMGAMDEDGIWPDLFVHLTEVCVGMLGAQLITGAPYPDWLIISRPYYSAPYLLVSHDPAIRSLADLPEGSFIGSPIYTPLDTELARLIGAGAAPINRLPYDDIDQVHRFLADGTMAAAIIWGPYIRALPPDRLHIGTTLAPLHTTTRSLGIVMRSRDRALMGMIDSAIASLADDGLLPTFTPTGD
ncbi:substrate-binding periplasmic protein [Ketogulonicigenium vulgare]|uniref:substrate-binding periplasmic protein n=1 Tax=Ketogulonicigenium vulgare TaxID=92945 RepID=UPI00235A3BC4|nr:hypothetical protein [Ketogulonicigenium vulgare]